MKYTSATRTRIAARPRTGVGVDRLSSPEHDRHHEAGTGRRQVPPVGLQIEDDLLVLLQELGGEGHVAHRTARPRRRTLVRSAPRRDPGDRIRHPQPSSSRRSSSMPKWWASSCTTVTATSSTTSSSVVADLADGQAVQRHPVGQDEPAVVAPLGQRRALVEAEQIAARRGGGPRRTPPRCPSGEASSSGIRSSASATSSSKARRPTSTTAGACHSGPGRRSGLSAVRPSAGRPWLSYPVARLSAVDRRPSPRRVGRVPAPGGHQPPPAAGHPGAGRLGQDPRPHPPARLAGGERADRPPPGAVPLLHPGGGRRAAAAGGQLGLRELPAAGTFHATPTPCCGSGGPDRRRRPPELLTDRTELPPPAVPRPAPAAAGRGSRPSCRGPRPGGVEPGDYAAGRPARPPPTAGRAGPDRGAPGPLRAGLPPGRPRRLRRPAGPLRRRPSRRDAGFAATQRWRFRHLFVDEFQDVNPLQLRLLRAWLGDKRRRVRRRRPRPGHLRLERGRRRLSSATFAEHFPGASHGTARPQPPLDAPDRGRRRRRARPCRRRPAGAAEADGPDPHGHRATTTRRPRARRLAGWCRARYHEGVGWSAPGRTRPHEPARPPAGQSGFGPPACPPGCCSPDPAPGGHGRALRVGRPAAARLATWQADAAAGDVEDLDPAASAPAGGADRGVPGARSGRLAGPLRRLARGPALDRRAAVGRGHRRHLPRGQGPRVAGGARGRAGGRASSPPPGPRAAPALAEERRLLHVALSRATDHLTCSWTRQRVVSAGRAGAAGAVAAPARSIDRCCRELAHDIQPAPRPTARR